MKKEKLPDKEETLKGTGQEAEILTEEEVKEEKVAVEKTPVEVLKEKWKPKTVLGKKVLSGEINDIDMILDEGHKILEAEIVEILLPELENDLLMVGQARGKFGGGQRRVFKQTQQKTKEGNKPSFVTYAVIGNKNGYVGLGWGKSKETVPAREKAVRDAKLELRKIRRGCGSWRCGCGTPHSIPFTVKGKCGSVEMILKPAPKGKGLIIEKECVKILKLAGIKDVFAKIKKGKGNSKINLIRACFDALKKLMLVKVNPNFSARVGLMEGKIKNE